MTYSVMQRGLQWVVTVLWLLGSIAGVYAQDVKSWEVTTVAGAHAFDQGRYAEAAQRFRAALAIADALMPDSAPEEEDPVTWRVSTSLMNLATVYHLLGEYADALPLYQRALVLYERLFGPQHPQLIDLLQAYADLYRQMFPVRSRLPWSTANKLQARARRIRERAARAANPTSPGSLVDDLSDILPPGSPLE